MASLEFMETSTAPWVLVPENAITSIEHPCIVLNNFKAIEMLGGAQDIARTLDHGTQQSLGLTFDPMDPSRRKILSFHNDVGNVLLKITVPKRTGRKRKRGSDDPWIEASSNMSTKHEASYLVKSLQDNSDASGVEAVGGIKSSHVWRAIPDFVYFTNPSNFLRGIENQLLPQQYPTLKQWRMRRTYGLEDTEVIPPPVFSTQSLSHNYTYRQNPAVRTVADPNTGNKYLHNRSKPTKLYIQLLRFDDPVYPDRPAADCTPIEELEKPIQYLVQQLKELFDKRPIWTRRALINSLPVTVVTQHVKTAAAYVCFSLRSGPWRDAYVKLGIDPRTDHKYRFYQTILLQREDRTASKVRGANQRERVWSRSPDMESHVFTGMKAATADGNTWQLCDLRDPILEELINVPELCLRAECEQRYFGWYANGTIAKIRVILKAKVDALTLNEPLDPTLITSVLQLPDVWRQRAKPTGTIKPSSGYFPDGSSKKELEWASAFRSVCRTASGDTPAYGSMGKGRLSKAKPKARPSYIEALEASGNEIIDPHGAELDIEEDGIETEKYGEPEEAINDDLDGDDAEEESEAYDNGCAT